MKKIILIILLVWFCVSGSGCCFFFADGIGEAMAEGMFAGLMPVFLDSLFMTAMTQDYHRQHGRWSVGAEELWSSYGEEPDAVHVLRSWFQNVSFESQENGSVKVHFTLGPSPLSQDLEMIDPVGQEMTIIVPLPEEDACRDSRAVVGWVRNSRIAMVHHIDAWVKNPPYESI